MQIPERFPHENGRDYALRTIKENIVHFQLEPGSQVSENELAAELGLSRTPVREALMELAKVKIIEIYPQRKTVVSLIDYNLVEETRFLRLHLDTAVMDLVCEYITEEELEELRENIRLQQFYLGNFNASKLLELDDQIHRRLFEIAKKPEIYALIDYVSIHLDRVRNLTLQTVKTEKDLNVFQDHVDLVKAIEARDAELAKSIMKKHLSRFAIDADSLRRKYPQYIK